MGVLAKQEVEILLNGGLDVSTGAEVQAVQTLRQADDVRTGDDGELVKRPKTASTQNVVNPGGVGVYSGLGAAGLIESRGEVYVATDNYGVMTEQGRYVSAGGGNIGLGALPWASTSVPKLARVSRLDVDRVSSSEGDQGFNTAAACTYAGTTLVLASVVYTSSTLASGCTLRLQALDIDTGAVIAQMQYDADGGSATAWAVDACENTDATAPGAVITFSSGSAGPYTLTKYRYRAATKDFVSDGSLKTDLRYVKHRIKTSPTAGRFYLGYENNSNVLYAAEINATAGTEASNHTGTHTALGGLDIVISGSKVCLVSAAQASSPAVYSERYGHPASVATLYTEGSTATVLSVTAARQTGGGNADQAAVFVTTTLVPGGVNPQYYRVTSILTNFSATTTAAIGSANTSYNNVYVVANAATVDDRAYVLASPSFSLADEQPTPCWLRHEQPYGSLSGYQRPVARVAHDSLVATPTNTGYLTNLFTSFVVGSKLHSVLATQLSSDSMPGPQAQVAQVVTLSSVDLTSAPCTSAKKDNVALAGTGLPFDIDGDTASIAQPYCRPVVIVDISSSGSTSAGSGNGLGVIAIYTWVDAANRLHRSAPSKPVTTGTFSNKRVDVYVAELPFAPFTDSAPSKQYSVEVYITTDGGSTYYRANTSGGFVLAQFSDGLGYRVYSDVQVGSTANVAVYSSGAGSEELTSEPTPPFHAVTTVGDRMFAIDAEDRSRVWFSKPFVAGFAPEWNTANTLFIGGQGVGISDIGGIPTVFARDGIYQIYGDGPNSLGAGSFAPARKLPHAIECLDALSVCKAPIGVFFRARRGVSLLANDGSLQPIGNSIDQALLVSGIPSGYCKIAYDELSEEVHVLDFDRAHYVFSVRGGKWSKWTQDVTFQDWEDCVAVNGQLFALHRGSSADALIRLASRDEADHRRHTGSGWSLQTPWIRFDGVTGNLRIWELIVQLRTGTPASGTTLGGTVTVTYETRDGASESFAWTPSEIYTEASGASERTINLRCRLASQRTRSFRVTITEASPAYEYDGHVPIAMRVHYGVSPGGERKKTQAQNRGG